MKIVIVQSNMDYLGGAQLLALDIAKEMSKEHDVSLITNKYDNSLFNKENLKIIETGFSKRLFNIFKYFFPEMELAGLLSLRKINKEIKKFSPDIVISINFPCNWVKHDNVFWYCQEPPFALYEGMINDIEFLNNKGFIPLYLLRKLVLSITRIIDKSRVKEVKKIFSNGKRGSFLINKIYGKKAKIIHPGIKLTKEKIPKKVNNKVKKLLINKGINLLVISRLFKAKNVELAVKTFNQLKEDNKRLIIVGEGPEFDDLKKIANDGVIFTGRISKQEKEALIKNCDIVLYPCLLEPFGLVPLEAMKYKKPVVAINQWGPKETIVNGKNGFLTKNSVNDFKKAIQKIASNKDLQKKMGEQGYNRLKNRFTTKKTVSKLLNEIKKVIKIN